MIDSKKKSLYIKGGNISMKQKVLKILEFDKVREQLLEHVSSSLGRAEVERRSPQLILMKSCNDRKKQMKRLKFFV